MTALLTGSGYLARACLAIIAAAAVILAPFAAARAIFRKRPPLGDDVIAMLCKCCDGSPELDCTCIGDCGRRYCKWATIISDREFTAELARMLDAEDGRHE